MVGVSVGVNVLDNLEP